MKTRTRRSKLAGLVLVAALGATACSSDPSSLRVARDLVNTLADSEAQRQCMLDKLDGYGKDEIEAIAKSANVAEGSQNVGDQSPIEAFTADLAACR